MKCHGYIYRYGRCFATINKLKGEGTLNFLALSVKGHNYVRLIFSDNFLSGQISLEIVLFLLLEAALVIAYDFSA